MPLLWWDAPGPYEVAFSTRRGGVSGGPYESLNLGLPTDDAPEHVEQNRTRLCEAVGADPARLAMNRQVHAATVNRAEPGERGREGDGLWTDTPDLPMLKLAADCLPVALARQNGGRPRAAATRISGRSPTASCTAQVSSTSSASTSARRATRSSSRTGATAV